eukprot:jgi/Mesen1/3740/ME000204S03002
MTEGIARDLERQEKREQKNARFYGSLGDGEDDDGRAKKARFPKARKGREGDKMSVDEDEPGGPILATDPRVAATQRAVRRKEKVDKANAEETSLLDDVAGAEEEFEGPDDEGEGNIEPFNLTKEREEGYFDAEGNYVEYRLDNDDTDAWLDSAEVDPSLAGKAAERAVADDAVLEDLSDASVAAIKRRLADALLPHETVLQALRRLGGAPGAGASGRGKAGSSGGRNQSNSKNRGRDNKAAAEKEKDREAATMAPVDKALFERITEDAMSLMDNGEYGVYSERRETFLREAEGYEALARARSGSGPATAPPAVPAGGQSGGDMFADDDDDDQGKPAAGAGASGRPAAAAHPVNGGSSADQGGRAAEAGTGDVSDMFGDNEVAAVPAPAPAGEGSGAAGDAPAGDGTGYYYDSASGYYCDPVSGLYGDPNTGVWYRYDSSSNSYAAVEEEAKQQVG